MSTADIGLDSATGDIDIANGDLVLVYDDDALRQRLKLRLEDVKGDWFRDLNFGTDWFGSILGKRSDLGRRSELRRVALATEGVSGISKLDLSYTSRALTIDLEVIKTGGGSLAVRFEELLGGA